MTKKFMKKLTLLFASLLTLCSCGKTEYYFKIWCGLALTSDYIDASCPGTIMLTDSIEHSLGTDEIISNVAVVYVCYYMSHTHYIVTYKK